MIYRFTIHRSTDGQTWHTLGEYRATSPHSAVELARKSCTSGARYWKTLGRMSSTGQRISKSKTFTFCCR